MKIEEIEASHLQARFERGDDAIPRKLEENSVSPTTSDSSKLGLERGGDLTMQVEESIRSKAFDGSIRFSLIQQVLIATLCLLGLDFGWMAKVCAVAMIAFWLGVALLVTQRRDRLSRVDLGFIRWGFPPIFLLATLLGSIWVSWHSS